MISFYEQDTDCHQLKFGEMTIWYSYKMPFAYKSKDHGLVIDKDAFDGKWGDRTLEHIINILISYDKYILSEKEVFRFNMEDQFKRTVLKMARDITFKGLKLC